MLYREGTLYRSTLLDSVEWVRHGFGTRLSGEDWPPEGTLSLKQIHSKLCFVAEVADGGRVRSGDGLSTATVGSLVAVRTADCVPVLLADTRRKVVAAVHAGWRGTAAYIVREMVSQMATEFGSRPEDLVAAIGPCIRECCYEVGGDVLTAFEDQYPVSEWKRERYLDLVEANRRQLVAAGVRMESIDADPPCTSCNATEFHSFRRDKGDGRMTSVIGLR